MRRLTGIRRPALSAGLKRATRSDSGQMLVLFIAVFSVLIGMAAFAVDQGLVLDYKRIAQKDVDTSARAGTSVFIGPISAGEALGTAHYNAAAARALAHADANAAPAPTDDQVPFEPDNCENTADTLAVCVRSSCPTVYGTIENSPSVEIGVRHSTAGLFTRLFTSGGFPEIGALSTACLFSTQGIVPGTLDVLPIEIRTDETERACFEDGAPLIGMQCVIKYSAQGGQPRGFFNTPGGDSCTGSGGDQGIDEIRQAIENGMTEFYCEVNEGNTCPPPGHEADNCVHPHNGVGGNTTIRDAFAARLARTNTCAADTFQDTFDYADGTDGPVLGPAGLGNPVNVVTGSVDAPTTVYVQKDCFSPRVALIVVSDGNGRPVRSFAAVYIMGCYHEDDPLTHEMNTCSPSSDHTPAGRQEIRAVLLRIVMPDGASGPVTSPDELNPLVIQTTR